MTETEAESPAPTDEGWEWAIVEIMGHRKHVGRVREEERFGTKLLRVDVPNNGAPETHGWTTHHYAASALFGFTLTDEAFARQYNKPYESPYRLTANRDTEIAADNAEAEDAEAEDVESDDGRPF